MIKTMLYERTVALCASMGFGKGLRRSEPWGNSHEGDYEEIRHSLLTNSSPVLRYTMPVLLSHCYVDAGWVVLRIIRKRISPSALVSPCSTEDNAKITPASPLVSSHCKSKSSFRCLTDLYVWKAVCLSTTGMREFHI